MTRDDPRITVYSDYVCPFCYLGRRSLSSYREERERKLTIDWRPFDLRSHKRGPDGTVDHSVEDGKDEEYFEQVRENVQRLKSQYDADGMLGMNELPEAVDSFDAQAVSLFVEREHPERWLAFDEAVFEALWLEGRDIGDTAVLVELGESVGLDGAAIRDAVTDERLRNDLRDRFREAKSCGITGVPTFVHGDHTARGAGPPQQLERLVEGP